MKKRIGNLDAIMRELRAKELGTTDPLMKKNRKLRNDLIETLMEALMQAQRDGDEVPVFMDRVAWALGTSAQSVITTVLGNKDDLPKHREWNQTLCEQMLRHMEENLTDPSVRWLSSGPELNG
jgi:hypothetical protein